MIDFELLSVLEKDADISTEETILNLRCRVHYSIEELTNELTFEDLRPEDFFEDEAQNNLDTLKVFDEWLRLQDYINRKLFPPFYARN